VKIKKDGKRLARGLLPAKRPLGENAFKRGLERNSNFFIKIISPITASTPTSTCNMDVEEERNASTPHNLGISAADAQNYTRVGDLQKSRKRSIVRSLI